ncbi:hypothetical protein [Sorangium sp. So ce341]|uniref:hypothetical protein n=1 Tax=Sorangium sp. So ce341 TaxID=3133302 RepID=UPI003F5FF4FF
MVFAVHRGELMDNHARKGKLGLTAMSVASFSATLALCSCEDPGSERVSSGTMIHQDVPVVDTRDGSLSARVNVVIDGGKITKLGAAPLTVTGAARSVDASGKYLVPGFLDLRTHALLLADAPATCWPMLMADGVTGVREMGGSPQRIDRACRFDDASAAGRVDAPEIVRQGGRADEGSGLFQPTRVRSLSP